MSFAFSVHNFISSVGADAGFAAIIGLAVLILLYFAHARETANLREEASILAERLQQAEARVAELSRPQPVSAAVPAAEGVQVRDQRATAGIAPFAPAGVGAPALAAATRVVPLPEPETAPAPAPAVAASAPVQTPTPEPAVALAATTAAATASPPAPPTSPPPSVPRPATAAGANASTVGGNATAAGANATAAGANGGGQARQAPPSLPPLAPLGPPARAGGGLARRVILGLVALLLLGAAVVALVIITGSSTATHPASTPARTTNAPAAPHPAAFNPASVTVSVLNGTATNQLAHRVAAKLGTSGYKEGKIATASNQTMTSTIVAYLPGAKNRAAALHVARALNLKPTAVQPIDQATQQVACPPPGACGANVVVTVGADLSTL